MEGFNQRTRVIGTQFSEGEAGLPLAALIPDHRVLGRFGSQPEKSGHIPRFVLDALPDYLAFVNPGGAGGSKCSPRSGRFRDLANRGTGAGRDPLLGLAEFRPEEERALGERLGVGDHHLDRSGVKGRPGDQGRPNLMVELAGDANRIGVLDQAVESGADRPLDRVFDRNQGPVGIPGRHRLDRGRNRFANHRLEALGREAADLERILAEGAGGAEIRDTHGVPTRS